MTHVPNTSDPSQAIWNLQIQRELPWDMMVSVGYVGTKGTHLVSDTVVIPAANRTGQCRPAGGPQTLRGGRRQRPHHSFHCLPVLGRVFRRDGFGANLMELTGVRVRTARKMGTAADQGRKDQQIAWTGGEMGGLLSLGVTGYCEIMESSLKRRSSPNSRTTNPFWMEGLPQSKGSSGRAPSSNWRSGPRTTASRA